MNTTRDSNGSDGGQAGSSATSRSLLAGVQADQPEAWERLVNLYAPLVLHWCRRSGLQDQDTADIFQEVFQAVVVYVGRLRKEREGDTFRGWLKRVTENKLIDHFRRRGHEARGVGGSSAQDRLAQLVEPEPISDDRSGDDAAEQALFTRALGLIRGEFEER